MRRGMRGFCTALWGERISGSESAIAATRLDSSIRSIHSIAALCASRILHCIGFNILVALELIDSPVGKGSGQELRPYLPLPTTTTVLPIAIILPHVSPASLGRAVGALTHPESAAGYQSR